MKRTTTPVIDVNVGKQGLKRETRDHACAQALLSLLLNRRVGPSICSWLPKRSEGRSRCASSRNRNCDRIVPIAPIPERHSHTFATDLHHFRSATQEGPSTLSA